MKFYAVHKTCDGGSSAGYSWHTSIKEARKSAIDYLRGQDAGETAKIKAWDIQPTKAGILRALNIHASHPNNG
jgi:hypothetical protein